MDSDENDSESEGTGLSEYEGEKLQVMQFSSHIFLDYQIKLEDFYI